MATTAQQPRSQTPTVIAATAIGTIFLAFGFNAIFRPASAMEMFPLPYSSSSETSELIDALM
ncbi:MAG: hypothetical protein Q9212_005485, partial [Teloschistes hypoglaucus]